MASITRRNGSYRVRIYRKNQNPICKSFTKESDAIQWLKVTQAQLELGLYQEPAIPSNSLMTSFRDAAIHYMKTHSIHKKIVRSETYRLQILIKRWGDLPIEKVDKLAVLTLRDDLLKMGRSGETINHYFNTISKLFQMLEGDWDIVIANPIRGIKRMPKPLGRTKRVSSTMEEHLLASCLELSMPLLSSIIQFAIQTGMRRGELMGLKWTDIDLPNRRAYLHTSKNGEPRQVPLTKMAIAVLQGLNKGDEDKVFPMTLNVLRNQYERARAYSKEHWIELGINPFIGLRFHDLRHEAISRMSDLGLNVIELSSISGHKTLAMLGRYTHPSHQAIYNKLDKVF
ncbi:site-specific integrase [Polynucleobacter sp. AP-Ainpum-60-G11]|uniref:site-specific integrase n=1 Tax=Polynucleobacter sp. AP-Ainpum-60-G11 TaxID=2576926 RepID=UPI001BFD8047|nr:site-specific integrase [Polynucleobacter sp. AP-Ainpum-60-G11]QWE27490.1 site-specific integrase [Polynucleobacter sp. AP-Ainpum-60-G11]